MRSLAILGLLLVGALAVRAAEDDRSLPFDPPKRGGAGTEAPKPSLKDAPSEEPKGDKPIIVVYSFISAFDSGERGAEVKTCIRGHALRGKKVGCFDPITEDETLARDPFRPDVKTPLADVARHARDNFKASYAVWGEITKKPREKDGYTLRVLGARIGEKDAELAADETYDCPNIHFVPQHAETFLAKLLGTERRDLERKWPAVKKELEPELCAGGAIPDDKKLPDGWTIVRDDVKDQVSFTRRPGGDEKDSCLVYHMKSATADSSGIAVLTGEIPVEEGAYYRVGADLLSKGPKVIIFVKGYADFGGQMREIYNHQARYYPEKPGEWERKLTEAFQPRHPWLKVQKLRVMLYAYHPAGDVFFDNVSVRKVEVEPVDAPKLPYKKEGGGADQ